VIAAHLPTQRPIATAAARYGSGIGRGATGNTVKDIRTAPTRHPEARADEARMKEPPADDEPMTEEVIRDDRR
jgi:hypothetical protein